MPEPKKPKRVRKHNLRPGQTVGDRARENRVRRFAARQGYRASRALPSDPWTTGTWRITDTAHLGRKKRQGLSLEEVEEFLKIPPVTQPTQQVRLMPVPEQGSEDYPAWSYRIRKEAAAQGMELKMHVRYADQIVLTSKDDGEAKVHGTPEEIAELLQKARDRRLQAKEEELKKRLAEG